jgi:hypothetical protein
VLGGHAGEDLRVEQPLPRAQHENVVRLLAGDLVDPAAVREGLEPLGPEVEGALAEVEDAISSVSGFPNRARLLEVNHRYAERFLKLQREWLREAKKALEEREGD